MYSFNRLSLKINIRYEFNHIFFHSYGMCLTNLSTKYSRGWYSWSAESIRIWLKKATIKGARELERKKEGKAERRKLERKQSNKTIVRAIWQFAAYFWNTLLLSSVLAERIYKIEFFTTSHKNQHKNILYNNYFYGIVDEFTTKRWHWFAAANARSVNKSEEKIVVIILLSVTEFNRDYAENNWNVLQFYVFFCIHCAV